MLCIENTAHEIDNCKYKHASDNFAGTAHHPVVMVQTFIGESVFDIDWKKKVTKAKYSSHPHQSAIVSSRRKVLIKMQPVHDYGDIPRPQLTFYLLQKLASMYSLLQHISAIEIYGFCLFCRHVREVYGPLIHFDTCVCCFRGTALKANFSL